MMRSISMTILLILCTLIGVPQPACAGLGNWVKSRTSGPPIETVVPVQLRGDHWCAYRLDGNYVKIDFATRALKAKAAKLKGPLGDAFLIWGTIDLDKPWLYHAESIRRDRGGDSRQGLTGSYSLDAECQTAAVTPGFTAFGASVAPAPSGQRSAGLRAGGAPVDPPLRGSLAWSAGQTCQQHLDWTCLSLGLMDDEGIATILETLRAMGACQ